MNLHECFHLVNLEVSKDAREAGDKDAMEVDHLNLEELVLSHCTSLKKLRIDKTAGANLRSLVINECGRLTSCELDCPQLDNFTMDGSTQDLEEIALRIGKVQRLTLAGMWKDLKRLVWSCADLETLVLNKCGMLTETQVGRSMHKREVANPVISSRLLLMARQA